MTYLIVCLLIAGIIGYTVFLNCFFKLRVNNTSYPAIEGARGYLAYFVFLHHLYIWHHYLHTGKWEAPSSQLFNHFGQSSVAFFFMITAFLFTNKLLDKRPVNWLLFFKGRFLRLFPLYAFAVFGLMIIVLILSQFKLNVSAGRFVDQFIHWLTFTYAGTPDMNKVENTYLIMAGVVWSLRYEILFYVTIPFLGILFGKKAGIQTLLLCLIVIILFFIKTEPADPLLFLNFLVGIFASFLHRYFKSSLSFKTDVASVICIILILVSVCTFQSAGNFISILLQAFVFIAITYGNSFFGILMNPCSQILGQLSYSIYLLHGMVLFVFNSFVFNRKFLLDLEFNQFLFLGLLLSFFISLTSFLTYKYIEPLF